jgi:type I restriction enzyme, S subunit
MSELPHGWAETTIGEVASYVSRGRSPKYVEHSELPVINQRCVRWSGIEDQHLKFVDPQTWDLWDADRFVRSGDVLWNSTGTGTIGRAALYSGLKSYERAVVDSHVTIVRVNESIEPSFLFRFIQSPNVQDLIEDMQSGSTNQVELNRSEIIGTTIPLPPLPEQRRIVAKLDDLTARTARARVNLDRIPTLIARYKSRLLALAFSGELTAGWRQANGALGGDGHRLPPGWAEARLGEISEIQGGIQVGKKRTIPDSLIEVPYLRVANVQRGWLNLSQIKTIAVTARERDRLLLKPGDILMNEGGDRDKLGRGWIWNGEIPVCIHQNHVFRIRLSDNDFPPEYISHYANENGQRYFFDEGTQTTNLASISKSKVAALPVPIPPTAEATEIVRLIDSAFGWLDRMEADYQAAAKLLPKLDAAILTKAFRGGLVAQDPADEPAGVLLDRMRENRAGGGKQTRTRKPRKSKETAEMARRLIEVLSEAADWLPAQEAFHRCGVADGAQTDEIEGIYAELRALDKAGRISVEPVLDPRGRKLHDRLKLRIA